MAERREQAITEHRAVPGGGGEDGSDVLVGTASMGPYSYSFELPRTGTVEIGRGDDADLQLAGSGVSRSHARLVMNGARGALSDLGSRNGTFVNRARLTADAEVGHGDEIGIGDARVTLLRRAALPSGVVPVRLRRAFEQALDAEIAAGRRPYVFVLELPERWYEIGAARELVTKLAVSTSVGSYNDQVLCFALTAPKAEALTLVASATRTLRASGVETSAGLAGEIAGDADTLLHAALKALVESREEDAAETAQRPVVTSPAMVRLHEEARRVARSPISILLVGETGVGKEVFARTIHSASGRTGPLIAVNTAALPEQLVESELFGHERGAFSGAATAKTGLIEAANGGTLFLDEIGELALPMQAKLLRVLEERTVRRVGATSERKVDIRVVAATNVDLEEAARQKRFRQDLLFRLNGTTIRIPPLRERAVEIPRLAEVFLVRAATAMRAPQLRLTAEAMALLQRYAWPGNLRELRNVIERAVAICAATGEPIGPTHLPDAVRGIGSGASAYDASGAASGAATSAPLAAGAPLPLDGVRDSVRDFERQRIVAALEQADGNQTKAAELLGLPRRTLAYKMARLGIQAPTRKP